MDRKLGCILCKEGYEAHEFTEDKWLAHEVVCVVDAERVKDGGQEHVFPDERDEAGRFKIRLD